MNHRPLCIFYSADPDLTRTLSAFLQPLVTLQPVPEAEAFRTSVKGTHAALVVVDLTHDQALTLLAEVVRGCPWHVAIAIGSRRSDPALAAEALHVYAVEAPDAGRERLQSLLKRAIEHLQLLEENRMLREGSHGGASPADARAGESPATPAVPVAALHFFEAFRHFDDVDAFFARVVEGVARYAHVSRVGVFLLDRRERDYRLRAGLRCLGGTREMTVAPDDAFVRWLSIHAHAIHRLSIGHVQPAADRLMLMQALDSMGAEVIIPLYGRDRIVGWLFLGHHITGAPFEAVDIENLVGMAEHVSLILDNALLYDEVAVQKTLAETVLHAIPVGIVAADAEGFVRWFNEAASQMLALPASSVLGQPLARLGSEVGHCLVQAAHGINGEAPRLWTDRVSGRTLSAVTRALQNGAQNLGSVALVQDLTRERLLREKQEQAERTAFWAEMAAAMSHEVRNPLVAISTFAQLLPERFADEAFRNQFSVLVAQEIGRLNGMIDQINAFADPPDLSFSPLRVDAVLAQAVANAVGRVPGTGARIERVIEPGLPMVEGDEAALVDCFGRLIANSLEAVAGRGNPLVTLAVSGLRTAGKHGISIAVTDNGPGLPSQVLDKAFSPFCTTKARGIGLGLPIARRTVTDHNGEIEIRSGHGGTTVTVWLPAYVPETEFHEACSGCG